MDDGQGVLQIKNVQSSDEGTYVCTGSNFYTIAMDEAQLTVTVGNQAPVVRIEPRQLSVDIGDAAEFRCFATGFPTPRIEWTWNRGTVLPINTVIENGVLRFQAVTSLHQGEYYCTASNSLGSDQQSAYIEVRSDVEPTFEVTVNQPEQQVIAGGDATLSCSARGNIAQVERIDWQREGGDLPPGAYQLNGQLFIPECQPTYGGRYVCTIQLVSGVRKVAYTVLAVSPDTDVTRPGEAPTAAIEPQRLIVKQGSEARLECVTTGSPRPSITWSKVRSELGPNQRAEGGTLFITNARQEDRGLYLCEVENMHGKSFASAVLEVERLEAPVIEMYPEKSVTIEVGSTVVFQCRVSGGVPPPVTVWSRADNKPFITETTQILDNGILRFVGVKGPERGQYICTASNTAGSFNYTIELQINGGVRDAETVILPTRPSFAYGRPVATISPNSQTLRPGDQLALQCTATGTQPVSIEWFKVDGTLSASTYVDRGLLEIVTVTAADGGRYKCRVTNRAGYAEAFADVVILVPPSAILSPQTVTVYEGQTVEFSCQVTGSPHPQISWIKDRGSLPERHTIEDGILRLYNLDPRDSGRYACVVTNDVGTTRDYGRLIVNVGGPQITEKEEVVSQGDVVQVTCDVTDGRPTPTIVWEKVGGPLPPGVQVNGNMLYIASVSQEDEGTYRCVASNIAGRVYQQLRLVVQAAPIVSVSKVTRSVTVGSNVTLTCLIQGTSQLTITWRKKDGQLPRRHIAQDNWLNINPLQDSDFGEYICEARNQLGIGEGVIVLERAEYVPYFGQSIQSYVAYPLIKDAYNSFDIEVTFKPESPNGLILYNGQYEWGGDFLSLGLVNGRVDFRFDVGSGPTVITSDPITLDTWHTVRIRKERGSGYLLVGDKEYTGRAAGRFVGLDLAQDMYLGGVPDYQAVMRTANQRSGFIGCISRLLINGIPIDLGTEALRIVGVIDCPSCNSRPCQNGGTCQPASTKTGYQCVCASGYSGLDCELLGTRCDTDTCGAYGRCYDMPGTMGYKCSCSLGKSGSRCEQGSSISLPGFSRTSFASYPTIGDSLTSVQIELTFFTQSLDDALLLYDASDVLGTSDFIALVIREGYAEFRYDLGSGPAVITSFDPLPMEQWVTAVAELSQRDGSLVINEGIAAKGQSAGNTVGLNLRTPLYVGGVDRTNVRISPGAGVDLGFTGCISELKIKGRLVDLINDVIDSSNVRDCSAEAPPSCALRPCIMVERARNGVAEFTVDVRLVLLEICVNRSQCRSQLLPNSAVPEATWNYPHRYLHTNAHQQRRPSS
jgi:dystroglycan 1